MHTDHTTRPLTSRETATTLGLFILAAPAWLTLWWIMVVGRFDWLMLSASPVRVMLAGLLLAGTGFVAVGLAWVTAVAATVLLSPPTPGRHR